MIDGVVLDLDDTLSDYTAIEARIWAQTASSVATALPSVDLEAARLAFGACREPLFERVLRGEWGVDEFRRGQLAEALGPWGPVPSALLDEHAALREAMIGQSVLMDGAHELLEALRGAGLRIGILTNGAPELVARKLVALDLEARVDGVTTGASAGAYKPEPAAYRAAAADIGVAPERVAMVGDHLEWDVLGALRAGYPRALWFSRSGEEPDAPLPPGAGVVHTLAEVPAALDIR